MCACGIPNKANYYVSVIISRNIPGGTETNDVDIYVCNEHMTDDIRSLFRFDDSEQWAILESIVSHLR